MVSSTSSDKSVEFEIVSVSNGIIKINGIEYDIGSDGTYVNYKIFSDSFTLLCVHNSAAFVEIPSGNRTALSDGDTFIASNGTWTYTPASGDPKTGTYNYFIYTDPKGDFAAYQNGTIYATKGADYFAVDTYSENSVGIFAHGKIGGEYTIDAKYTYSSGVTTPYPYDVEINMTISEIENNDLSVKIDNFYKTVTNESGEKTNATILLVVPIKYMAISNNNAILLSIINIIPILLIAAVLIGIGYSIMRRD